MKNRFLAYFITFTVGLLCFAGLSHAQFKEDIYAQDPNTEPSASSPADTTSKIFSFKEFFGGLAHKNTMKISTMFAGSVVLPGTAQIYNKDYWKLPIVYGGIGACAGTGGYYLHKYKTTNNISDKRTGTWLLAGAGLMYWGTLLDGVVNYQADEYPHPGRATLYSLLLPGLGQIYNGELYKVPIYWGGLLVSVHCLTTNHTNYIRFKTIHNEATNPDINYTGPFSGETAKWYRDVYRRYRDYSIVATALVYFLQVIDANVFAYMHDFEVTDDISMKIEPAVIAPDNAYAMGGGGMNPSQSGVGLKLGVRF